MNNKKNTKIKTVLRLFPYLSDKDKANKLKIDPESISFISLREHADYTSLIIEDNLIKLGANPKDVIITDATAGVGGNTLSFAKNFKQVNAIEIDKLRTDYLINNISIYEFKNIKVFNQDCLNLFTQLKHDVVFVDPPWGGKSYKNHKSLRLSISDISIEDICNNLLLSKNAPLLIVLKLPRNYDVAFLYKKIIKKRIYYYDIKDKMGIFVIYNT